MASCCFILSFCFKKKESKNQGASFCFPQPGDEVEMPQMFGSIVFFFNLASVFKIKISHSILCDSPASINREITDSSLVTEG